jgi:hypothetical protein
MLYLGGSILYDVGVCVRASSARFCFDRTTMAIVLNTFCQDRPVPLTLYTVRLASIPSLTRSLTVCPTFCRPDAGPFMKFSHRCCRLLLSSTHDKIVVVTFMARRSGVLTPFWSDRTTMAIVLNMCEMASRPRPVLTIVLVVPGSTFRSA